MGVRLVLYAMSSPPFSFKLWGAGYKESKYDLKYSPPLFLHIRESRAYRRTYTDVGYEGFFHREIIGESVKPPRSFTVIPFFLFFLFFT